MEEEVTTNLQAAAEATAGSGAAATAGQTGDEWAQAAIDFLTAYGMKVLAAILILVIGLWLAKRIQHVFEAVLRKKSVDDTLVDFFGSIIKALIIVAVVIAAISQLGVQTTSLVALVGAAGLAVGLALQGSLSNFASGVLIIMFKPFKSGDFVILSGEMGTVVEIGLLMTELKSPDAKKVIIPNSAVMGGVITNITHHAQRRVDLVIGVSYSDDLDKTKAVIDELIAADERILKDPEPMAVVSELADSSVNFTVRLWVDSANWWPVKCDFTKAVKQRFDKEGISIPFPQRDVHLFNEPA